jgi:hypothetical protein
MVVVKTNILETHKKLNYLIIKADDTHIYLYNKDFWTYHFKVFKLIMRFNRQKSKKKLKLPSLFLWIKLIPLIIILWYAISFTILIGLNLEDADRNLLFLVNFPHTLLMFWLYHKLSNKMIRNYHKKIEWNINVLKNIR